MEWFLELSSIQQVYWIITGISTLFFLFILFSTFLGFDTDDIGDVDAEIDADTGAGFQFFTFKNMVGFFTIFGWSGISSLNSGNSTFLTILISTICGLIMMTVMAALFYYINKLNDSGTLKMENAVGAVGEVYLTIGANRSSIGKVHVRVQNSLRELEALTDHEENLTQGTVVTVTEVTSNGILIVKL